MARDMETPSTTTPWAEGGGPRGSLGRSLWIRVCWCLVFLERDYKGRCEMVVVGPTSKYLVHSCHGDLSSLFLSNS